MCISAKSADIQKRLNISAHINKEGDFMKILSKNQMTELMKEFPNGGLVFADYKPSVLTTELMVTDGEFGAREVIPLDGEVFDFDWNINEYRDDEQFAVFDNSDVLQMIQTLTSGLHIQLETWSQD